MRTSRRVSILLGVVRHSKKKRHGKIRYGTEMNGLYSLHDGGICLLKRQTHSLFPHPKEKNIPVHHFYVHQFFTAIFFTADFYGCCRALPKQPKQCIGISTFLLLNKQRYDIWPNFEAKKVFIFRKYLRCKWKQKQTKPQNVFNEFWHETHKNAHTHTQWVEEQVPEWILCVHLFSCDIDSATRRKLTHNTMCVAKIKV